MVISFLKSDKIFKPSEEVMGYVIDSVIGEGRFGICYKVSRAGKSYIMKQLKKKMLKKSKKKINFEEDILKVLDNDAIPRFVEKIISEKFFAYIIEFKEGKNFEELIYDDGKVFHHKEIIKIGMQLINILNYLHLRGIVHRDIRVPNVIYNNGKISLVDFGLARWSDNKKYKVDVDFAFLGDFLLYLYYSNFQGNKRKNIPWYEELDLLEEERFFLKKLLGVEERYNNIIDLEKDYKKIFNTCI